jgi:Nitrile hydratase, alpha chain
VAHDHPHDHDHPHPRQGDHPAKAWERREAAIRSLLIDKGVLSAEDIRRKIEEWEQKTPALGARIVARSWVDGSFESRLLADGNAAAGELGIDGRGAKIVALKNTTARHHLVVCTLCSCYPRALLGLRSATRAACWRNSAPACRQMSNCAWSIAPPTAAIWFSRCAPRARKAGTRHG